MFTTVVSILAAGTAISVQLHLWRKSMSKSLDNVNSAVDRLTASVAKEIRQLADAVSANSDNIDASAADAIVSKLNALADQLDSDDAPVVEPPPPVA